MEIFMQNISYSTTHHQLVQELAIVLHRPPYTEAAALPLNFHINLFRPRGSNRHIGSGALTLPTSEAGARFLANYGHAFSPVQITIGGRRVKFSTSKLAARPEVVERITRRPYINPRTMEEKEHRDAVLASEKISIQTIQFGWECRDSVFSIEWEETFNGGCFLSFDGERREMRIKIVRPLDSLIIAIRFPHIITLSAHDYLWTYPVIFLILDTPPMFESETVPATLPRRRLPALPISDHMRIVPYASLAMRLVCTPHDIKKFKDLARLVQLHDISEVEYRIDYRGLFSIPALAELQEWLRQLDWCVSFQVEAIVRSLAVDVKEMLSLKSRIKMMIDKKGISYTASMLHYFGPKARDLFWDPHNASEQSIEEHFIQAEGDFELLSKSLPIAPIHGSLFHAYHAIVTPTTMYLEGPFLERSNRVIRKYDGGNDESFLRVSFAEEDRLQYRFDRETDGPTFIRSHVGQLLLHGLKIAHQNFQFLAYSQSALKEHSVWFVKPFQDSTHGDIDASAIIASLGSFDNLEFDPRLMYCPARYGARIAQAFTATDASVSIREVEEVIYIIDIKTSCDKYCFTDGVGTLSKELAIEISQELRSKRRRARYKNPPRAFQVRFMGSKGMLSVDHSLKGRAICLRPSMIKFEAPHSMEIEIARAFDRPAPYFLNRPLIMLLEGLGVPYDVFKMFQEKAVQETWQSTRSFAQAARTLESHGLGTSYRLSSILLGLENLGVNNMPHSDFYQQMLEYAINHILRVLKNHARIPIPDAWTLVGVADVHKFLQEGEIFACIKPPHRSTIFLEGPVLISRSPTIHPGDVQIATAIGRPPEGSCFSKEALPNTVVFSVLGSRPLPSCLGGGDLDGDVYNLIPLEQYPEFRPRTCSPSNYEPATRKLLERVSTMTDVAEFVMEYINSDVVGIVAINWLILADQSPEGIMDKNCLELARLHSDAVDYPKSGNPVALDKIPKPFFRERPDWNAPETGNPDSDRYYQSRRAIGRLFRDIDLPVSGNTGGRRSRRRQKEENVDHLTTTLSHLEIAAHDVHVAIANHVSQYIDVHKSCPHDQVEHITSMFLRYVSELKTICSTCTLSHVRTGPLSEEEAIIGTIAQKSSQPRKRKDMMSKLREQTDILVRGIREDIAGDDEMTLVEVLETGWLAWKLSLSNHRSFGGESFGWVALGTIFETIKEIEQEGQDEWRHM